MEEYEYDVGEESHVEESYLPNNEELDFFFS